MSRSDEWREPPGVSIASWAEGGKREGRWLHKEQQKGGKPRETLDRKSTRLNSSHSQISYAVFCLKKKNVNSHTVLDCIITTIMAPIQRIHIIGSRERSRNRRRLKANQTGKKFRVGIKSNISTNRNNLISGVDRCIHLNAMKKTFFFIMNRQPPKS